MCPDRLGIERGAEVSDGPCVLVHNKVKGTKLTLKEEQVLDICTFAQEKRHLQQIILMCLFVFLSKNVEKANWLSHRLFCTLYLLSPACLSLM